MNKGKLFVIQDCSNNKLLGINRGGEEVWFSDGQDNIMVFNEKLAQDWLNELMSMYPGKQFRILPHSKSHSTIIPSSEVIPSDSLELRYIKIIIGLLEMMGCDVEMNIEYLDEVLEKYQLVITVIDNKYINLSIRFNNAQLQNISLN